MKDAAKSGAYDAVVNTDVTAFFEQIRHDKLEAGLLALGVRAAVVHEIRKVIDAFMKGQGRGLPQARPLA